MRPVGLAVRAAKTDVFCLGIWYNKQLEGARQKAGDPSIHLYAAAAGFILYEGCL